MATPPPLSTVNLPFLDPVGGLHALEAIFDAGPLLLGAPLPLAVAVGDCVADPEPLALAAPGLGAIGRGRIGLRRAEAVDEVVDCGLPFELVVERGDGPAKGGDGVLAEMVNEFTLRLDKGVSRVS